MNILNELMDVIKEVYNIESTLNFEDVQEPDSEDGLLAEFNSVFDGRE